DHRVEAVRERGELVAPARRQARRQLAPGDLAGERRVLAGPNGDPADEQEHADEAQQPEDERDPEGGAAPAAAGAQRAEVLPGRGEVPGAVGLLRRLEPVE